MGKDRIGRQDRGDARAYRALADHKWSFALDQGRVANAHARHIGDGVPWPGWHVADSEA
jgi:hypothetical protein